MKKSVLVATNAAVRMLRTGLQQFDYPAESAGTTADFEVFSATALGDAGLQVAQAVLANCERDYSTLSGYFGGLTVAHMNVIVAPLSMGQDGSGGAYHYGCDATDLYVDVELQPAVNTDLTNALVVAEETEVFEATQGLGWDCGASNGEGLSRVMAEVLYPGVLDAYSTAGYWLDNGRPNWVDQNEATDQDPLANGCSVLFLFWLNVRQNFGWPQICQAGAATLAQTYQQLTGNTTAWNDFSNDVNALFPPGQPSGVTTDNPF